MASDKPASNKPASDKPSRFENIRTAFTLTRRNDPKMLPLVAGAALVVLVVFVLLGLLFGQPIYFSILAVLLALLAATLVFGRRAASSAFSTVEGQPGAAAAVISSLRGDWRVTPAVSFTRNQDLVHRVVGRPGVVLVAEGAPSRTGALLGQEKRRVARVVGDTPVYDLTVGDEAGQIPLRKLQGHLTKLPRNLKPAQVDALDARLKALGGTNVPLPKGPLPRSGKVPRGKMR